MTDRLNAHKETRRVLESVERLVSRASDNRTFHEIIAQTVAGNPRLSEAIRIAVSTAVEDHVP